MKHDFELRRREVGTRPPEELERILGRIYPEETVKELMRKLAEKNEKEEDDHE